MVYDESSEEQSLDQQQQQTVPPVVKDVGKPLQEGRGHLNQL
jgi:hypothetical protein